MRYDQNASISICMGHQHSWQMARSCKHQPRWWLGCLNESIGVTASNSNRGTRLRASLLPNHALSFCCIFIWTSFPVLFSWKYFSLSLYEWNNEPLIFPSFTSFFWTLQDSCNNSQFSGKVLLLSYLNKGLTEKWMIDLVTNERKCNLVPEGRSEYLPSSITTD